MACYRCGTPRYWESGVLGQGGPGGLAGKGGSFGRGGSGKAAGFFGQGGVASAMGGTRIIGPTFRDQVYVPRGEPTFRKGNGVVRVVVTRVLVLGAGSCRRFLVVMEVTRWVGVEGLGRYLLVQFFPRGIRRFLLYGRWLGFLIRRLGHRSGSWWKPASPAPATPMHAQIVARLHGLYDSETELIQKVDEVEGRVEKAKAKVVEEEAALAGVQGELQGVKDQIMATLKEEADCRERTRKEGTDSDVMEDGVNRRTGALRR